MSILDRSTVLITGASSGLGAEFARQLAPRARCLILAARRLDRLEELAGKLARDGLAIHTLCVDLAEENETERFLGRLQSLRDTGVQVNVLINNAGLGDHGLFEDADWKRVKGMIDVNVKALTRVTHALLRDLVLDGGGAILNVSSIASFLPLPQMAVYAASKAYVTSFSEALRAELRGTNVSVTTLCPGPVDTEFSRIAGRANSSEASLAAPEAFKVPAEQVVLEGLRAMENDRARVVPGWFVCTVMTLTAAVPLFILRFFLNRRGRTFTGH
jgi:short-subunit dehydrogenase